MTKNSRVFEKNCIYCGHHFVAAKPFGKFCADKCRVYYSIDKKAYEQNINEQLPALLSRVNEEMDKLYGNNDTEKYELRQAISLILKVQTKLDAASIKLRSFDEHLIQKNKAKGIHPVVKESQIILTPKIKQKKIVEVIEVETESENIQIEEEVFEKLLEIETIIENETIITDINTAEEIETESLAEVKTESLENVETEKVVTEQTEEHHRSSNSPINAVASSSPDKTGETPNSDELDMAKAWLQRYLKKGFDKVE